MCIGELLIDFICSDVNIDLIEGMNFIKKAGGAPANVTATISKLGGEAFFAGKVGADQFGLFLKKSLDEVGVDTSMLIMDGKTNTTLAFVSLKSHGERDFVFNRGADKLLNYNELDENEIYNSKIIHFGSATALLGGPSKETYIKVMEVAREKEIFISFDPNYRVDLWKDRLEEFIGVSRQCLKYADFAKVSDEEIRIISGEEDIAAGVKVLHQLGVKAVAVTLGKEGTYISNEERNAIVQSIKVESIDSTGAGDAFVGAYLYRIASFENGKNLLNDFEKMKEITTFANKVGAIVCTKLGAISALPTLDEVEKIM